MEDNSLIHTYIDLIPPFVTAFVIATILTPYVIKLAFKVRAIDLPAHLRDQSDSTASRRIHKKATPKLGGLGMALAFLLSLFLFTEINQFSISLFLGSLIITVMGFLDDKYNLNGKTQLLLQSLAALIIISSNTVIKTVDIGIYNFDFQQIKIYLDLSFITLDFYLLPVIITLVWIVGITNFINWVGGIDGLNGSVTAIVLIAMLLISVKLNNLYLTPIIALHLGGVLGVLPYNMSPAKVFYGTIGDHLNGYLIAVFALISGGKTASLIILIGLPLIDALWVLYKRLKQHPNTLFNPLKLLHISDTNHLHHRLLQLGYTPQKVVQIEVGVTILLSVIAFAVSGFREDFIAVVSTCGLIILLFTFLDRRIKKR